MHGLTNLKMSSVIVAKVSVILAFKFVISWTGVKNTLSLTYPLKKKSGGGGDIRWSWWPGCQTISPDPPVWKCRIQKPTNTWTPVWRCTILLENYPCDGKKKYVCIPRSFLVISACNQGKTLCSPCSILTFRFWRFNHRRFVFGDGSNSRLWQVS